MWKILQYDRPEDFVLATNTTYSTKEFCEIAFNDVGLKLEWLGEGENEIGVIKSIEESQINSLINPISGINL